jgi:hypothetical protein
MRKTILFFAICALYILSFVTMILDFVGVEILLVSTNENHPLVFQNSCVINQLCA